MTLAQHEWPPELETASACFNCGLSYDEWNDEKEAFCKSGAPPLLVELPIDEAETARSSSEWKRLATSREASGWPVSSEADALLRHSA